MRKKFYVVWNGYATGVFDSWEECQLQTKGYPGAKYKSFDSQEAAVEAYRGDPAEQIELLASIAKHRPAPVNYESFPDIRLDSLAVDAACSKNPGPVDRLIGIGEYLALVHGLALLKSQGRPNTPIYTDSRTARAWVRNRQPKTTLPRTPQNERLFEMIERATAWLNANPLTNPILTWDTPAWGEIPADFGRK